MEEMGVLSIDPETAFIASKQQTGFEWELFKENTRPLKRGRNVRLLNESLKSHNDNKLKQSLIQKRRRLVQAIDEYEGDDPLQPWIECIKWVQEAFPAGGDYSGLVVIYEQCVRTFWHSELYKEDVRYLKVWLEYAEQCDDGEVIFNFLDANDIGKTHAAYYIAVALHKESKSKMKAANDIFNLGISRNAQPIERLQNAYKKFIARSMRRPKDSVEDSKENQLPARSFGTLLTRGENRSQITGSSNTAQKKRKPEGLLKTPFSVYNDSSLDVMSGHQNNKSKADSNPWNTLGARAERNKENKAIPSKWTTYKIPQKPVSRIGGATSSASIEVFIDEECAEKQRGGEVHKSSSLQLRQIERGEDVKKETELLRENPLRNFPPNSLPR